MNDYRHAIAKEQLQSAIRGDLKRGNNPDLTLSQWIRTLEYFQWCCAYCQKHPPTLLLEHFIPRNHGGFTHVSNCVPACYSCNNRKGGHHPLKLPERWGMNENIQRVYEYLQTLAVSEGTL